MLSLYLLRHGETEFSQNDRFCGRIDAPLTADGQEMAVQFAAAYGDLQWRAITTSSAGAGHRFGGAAGGPRPGSTTCVDERLDEMDYGAWQGLTKAEAAARDREYFARWQQIPASDRRSASRRGTSPPGRWPPSSSSVTSTATGTC